MQSIISASEKSDTEKIMVGDQPYLPLYKVKKSLPPSGTQHHEITPYINITGAIANKSVTFQEVSGAGFLVDESFGFLCTCLVDAADIAADAPVAINMVRSLEVFSKGNLVIYMTGEAILARVRTLKDKDFQIHCLANAKMLDPIDEEVSLAGATSFLTYLPSAQSYLDTVEKALLTSVIGDIQVRITFNDTVTSGLTNPVTAITANKYSFTYMPQLSVYNQMVKANWENRLSMTMVNTDTEEAPLTTTTTVDNYVFTTAFLVAKTHLMIKQINTTSGVGCPVFKINTVKSLVVGGIPYMTNLKCSRVKSNAARRGVSSTAVSAVGALSYDNDILTIDWGILCALDQNTGTFFGQQLRGTKVSIIFEAGGGAIGEYKLFAIHEYFQQVDYVPDSAGGRNGYLMISENS